MYLDLDAHSRAGRRATNQQQEPHRECPPIHRAIRGESRTYIQLNRQYRNTHIKTYIHTYIQTNKQQTYYNNTYIHTTKQAVYTYIIFINVYTVHTYCTYIHAYILFSRTYIHTYIWVTDWEALQDNESREDAQHLRQVDVHSDGHRELPDQVRLEVLLCQAHPHRLVLLEEEK